MHKIFRLFFPLTKEAWISIFSFSKRSENIEVLSSRGKFQLLNESRRRLLKYLSHRSASLSIRNDVGSCAHRNIACSVRFPFCDATDDKRFFCDINTVILCFTQLLFKLLYRQLFFFYALRKPVASHHRSTNSLFFFLCDLVSFVNNQCWRYGNKMNHKLCICALTVEWVR